MTIELDQCTIHKLIVHFHKQWEQEILRQILKYFKNFFRTVHEMA